MQRQVAVSALPHMVAIRRRADGVRVFQPPGNQRQRHRHQQHRTQHPAILRANQTDSDVNLLANPRIRARNREKAKILIGERVPNITSTITATGFSSESVTYIDVAVDCSMDHRIQDSLAKKANVANAFRREIERHRFSTADEHGDTRRAYEVGIRRGFEAARIACEHYYACELEKPSCRAAC